MKKIIQIASTGEGDENSLYALSIDGRIYKWGLNEWILYPVECSQCKKTSKDFQLVSSGGQKDIYICNDCLGGMKLEV